MVKKKQKLSVDSDIEEFCKLCVHYKVNPTIDNTIKEYTFDIIFKFKEEDKLTYDRLAPTDLEKLIKNGWKLRTWGWVKTYRYKLLAEGEER